MFWMFPTNFDACGCLYINPQPLGIQNDDPNHLMLPRRSDWPAYMETVDEELPWLPGDESSFTRLLPQDGNSLAGYYKPDIWHIVQLGVAKSWVASCFVLILPFLGGNSIPERLQALSAAYGFFCSSSESWHVSRSILYRLQG